MATTMLPTGQRAPEEGPGDPARPVVPIKWWAALGGVCLALIAYSWGRWLLGGHAEPVDPGDTPVPTRMVVAIRIFEAVDLVGLPAVVYLALIRPWRRGERSLTFDGTLVIGLLGAFMLLDNIQNYTQFWYSFNAEFLDLGCPQCYLPGWQSDASNFPVPLLFATGFYVMGMYCIALLLSNVMRLTKARRPQLGTPGLLLAAYGVGVVLDFFMEILFAWTGTYTLAGANSDWSLFSGRYFQFPIYEAFTAPVWFVALGALRYFSMKRGQTPAERGIERIKTSPARLNGLRAMASVGLICLITFVSYIVPQYVTALHSGAWPSDVTDRSYFGVCGPTTGAPCPGPDLEVPPRGER